MGDIHHSFLHKSFYCMKTYHPKTLFKRCLSTFLVAIGIGSWALVTAQPGSSLVFDGSGDYVVVPASAQNGISGTAITLEAWIYPTSWKATYGEGNIIAKEAATPSGFMLRAGQSGSLGFTLGDGSSWMELVSGTGVLTLNKWQHVAGTYDGTTAKIFVNGVMIQSQNVTLTIANPAQNLVIGSSAPYLGSREFPGRIDEVRIWSVSRTPNQLLDGMYREMAGNESGLAAYFKMSNGSGTTLTDNVSSGGTNGTITNATWKTSTARLTTASEALKYRRAGTGLDFDGTNDYVAIADANALDLTKNFTLEAWVNPSSLGAGYSRILGKSGAYGLGINSSTIRLSTYGVQDYDLTYTVPAGQWSHIAVVMNNTDDALFYVNGILRGTVDGAASAEISSDAMWIGASSNGGGEQYFTGKIDEVRIWNTPRTASQIQDNMLRVVDPASANLVATYRFDEGAGTTLTDATANALNGTLANMDAVDWVSAADREPLKVWQTGLTWQVDSAYVLGSAPVVSTTNREWVEITKNMGVNTGAACYAGNVSVPTGISFSNSNSQTLNLNGSLINNGTISTTTGQIRFQDSANQAVLTGTGSFSVNTLYVTSPYGLLMEQNVATRTLYIQSGTGNLILNGRKLTIGISGVINGTSIVGSATSDLEVSGTGSQVFLPGMTVRNLTLSKANGIRLVDNLRIEGNLALNSGRVDLNLKTITFGPSATVSTTSSFSNTRMIDASNGFVVKEFTEKGSFLFPVGDIVPTYSPIQLNFLGGTFGPSASVTVTVNNSTHPNNTSENNRIDRFWTVNEAGISDFVCRVDAWYDPADVVGDEMMLKSSKWDGSAWLILGDADYETQRIYGTVEGFSDFTAGEEEVFAALPVELISFTATPNIHTVDLNWTTANETNSEYFGIERSVDGKRFLPIGRLAAAGNSTVARNYHFADEEPLEDVSYYRLRQTDMDGQVHFSNTVEVSLSQAGIELFPNPTEEGFWIVVPQDMTGTFYLTTVMGKLVKTVRITGDKQYVSVAGLPQGVYYGTFKLRGMKGVVEKIVIK
jgi:hypothetical protein